jgi:hypothetical protein
VPFAAILEGVLLNQWLDAPSLAGAVLVCAAGDPQPPGYARPRHDGGVAAAPPRRRVSRGTLDGRVIVDEPRGAAGSRGSAGRRTARSGGCPAPPGCRGPTPSG